MSSFHTATTYRRYADTETFGRFRWVQLQLELFLSPRYCKKHPKDIISSLINLELHSGKGVPQLNVIYGTIYRMNTDDQPHAQLLARRILRWMLLPLSPVGKPRQQRASLTMVKLTAVVDATSIYPDGTRDSDIDVLFIANLCSNLIVVDQSTESFRFAHLSVVEYLQIRVIPDTSPPDKEYSFGHVSTETATSCLSTIAHAANNDDPAIRAIIALPHLSKPKRLEEMSIQGASKKFRICRAIRSVLLAFLLPP
jgi:hypothetical protein